MFFTCLGCISHHIKLWGREGLGPDFNVKNYSCFYKDLADFLIIYLHFAYDLGMISLN